MGARGVAGKKVYIEMPAKYLAEMICDRIAASKTYLKDKYDKSFPLKYLEERTDKEGMNPYFTPAQNSAGLNFDKS